MQSSSVHFVYMPTFFVVVEQELGPDRNGDVLLPKEVAESGKKKSNSTSLNHLLNFTVASTGRKYSGRGGMPPITRHRKRNTSHCYNKEEFLQAK